MGMTGVERQERWYRARDLESMRAHVGDAPLVCSCRRREGGGTIYQVSGLDGTLKFEGRYQAVCCWIDGYVAAWAWATKC